MTTAMLMLSAAVFLGLPPVLLALKFVRGKPGWWKIVVAIPLIGWVSWYGTGLFYLEWINDPINAAVEPRGGFIDGWLGDRETPAFDGWAIASVYTLPWYVVYLVALYLRRNALVMSGRELLPPEAYRPPGRRL